MERPFDLEQSLKYAEGLRDLSTGERDRRRRAEALERLREAYGTTRRAA